MKTICMLVVLSAWTARASEDDRVHSVPGFEDSAWKSRFKVYSGFLNVSFPHAIGDYDGVVIHYQFHTSRNDEENDPVVAWHTGGPGGSSIYGQYSEMGFFQVSLAEGTETNTDTPLQFLTNEHSWNKVANMLYMESPAGSFLTPVDLKSGFSYCLINGKRQDVCHWNDRTQAEAYVHTLRAFYDKFPTFQKNDLYLAGESYGTFSFIASLLIPVLRENGLACGAGLTRNDSSLHPNRWSIRAKHCVRDLEKCARSQGTAQGHCGREWLLGR